MDEHLGVPINTLIKLFVRNLCVLDVDLVRHDEAGLGSARDDQVAQVAVVGLDIALASSELEALEHSGSELKVDSGSEGKQTFSKSLPKLRLIIPLEEASSGAPGSLDTSQPIVVMMTTKMAHLGT